MVGGTGGWVPMVNAGASKVNVAQCINRKPGIAAGLSEIQTWAG